MKQRQIYNKPYGFKILFTLFVFFKSNAGDHAISRQCNSNALTPLEVQELMLKYSMCTKRLHALEPGEMCQTKYSDNCITVKWGSLQHVHGELKLEINGQEIKEIKNSSATQMNSSSEITFCFLKKVTRALLTLTKGWIQTELVIYTKLDSIEEPFARLEMTTGNSIKISIHIEDNHVGSGKNIYIVSCAKADSETQIEAIQPYAFIVSNKPLYLSIGGRIVRPNKDSIIERIFYRKLRSSTEYKITVTRVEFLVDKCIMASTSIYAKTKEAENQPEIQHSKRIMIQAKTFGAIAATIVVFVLVGFVGLYFFAKSQSTEEEEEEEEDTQVVKEETETALVTEKSSESTPKKNKKHKYRQSRERNRGRRHRGRRRHSDSSLDIYSTSFSSTSLSNWSK